MMLRLGHGLGRFLRGGLALASVLLAVSVPAEESAGRRSITVVADDNYPPYIFRNAAGAVDGYLVDAWKRWEEKTGVRVELVATDWAKAQDIMARGQADVIDTIFRTPEREGYLAFSKPYADLPVPLYIHRDIGGINGIDTLRGFLVGVKAGDACADWLRGKGIATLKEFDSYQHLVDGAVAGQVKVFCLDEPPANYLLYRAGVYRDYRKAFTLYSGQFHRAVKRGNDELLGLVQEGFDRMTPAEQQALRDKWMGKQLDLAPWRHYLAYGLVAAVLLGGGAAVWGGMLRRQVKRRTAELENERGRLRTLIDTLPDLVWLKNPEGVFLACNPEFGLLLGASEAEIVGRTDYDFVPREMADFFREKDREAIARGGPGVNEEEVVYAGDGRRVLLETIKTPMFDTRGRLIGVLGIGRDITARRIEEQERRLAAQVYENTDEGIIITDPNAVIVAVNRAFTHITGYSAEEVRGHKPSMLRSGRHEPIFYQELWAALLETGVWQGEIWNRRKNGEIYPEWLTISAVKDNGKTTHYVSVFSDITTVKRSQEALSFLAHHDPLTELPNRILLRDRLEHALRRAQRERCGLAVLFIDLDRFKQINDTLGHPVGDRILQLAARMMKDLVRASDTVARIGGDEFIILLEDEVSVGSVATVAHKLVERFAQPFAVDDRGLYVTASVGISIFPHDGEDVDALLKHADLAMYKAKEQGRSNFQFYEAAMGAGAFERLTLENALRGAVQRKELLLHYQPQVELATGTLAGVEALVRWRHQELGLVPPGRFIPVAEEMGIIGEIGDWVLQEACRQMAAWQAAGFAVPRVAVNLSMQQLEGYGLVGLVTRLLDKWGLPAGQLELEVTESVIMRQTDRAVKILEGLRELGVYLAVDDFGTGYSSLGYLRQLPVHRLKIDYSFVRDIGRDANDEAIARAIIGLGRSLGLEVVAEGVEREEQAAFLAREGCDVAQGFLYAKPMPPEELEAGWQEGAWVSEAAEL
jgi:diguanylate cyclase (GGDEF)-like protein/PAS domain S-box-containing protein